MRQCLILRKLDYLSPSRCRIGRLGTCAHALDWISDAPRHSRGNEMPPCGPTLVLRRGQTPDLAAQCSPHRRPADGHGRETEKGSPSPPRRVLPHESAVRPSPSHPPPIHGGRAVRSPREARAVSFVGREEGRGGEEMGGRNSAAATPVLLNVYDLTPANDYLYWLGFGVFHSGIEAVPPDDPMDHDDQVVGPASGRRWRRVLLGRRLPPVSSQRGEVEGERGGEERTEEVSSQVTHSVFTPRTPRTRTSGGRWKGSAVGRRGQRKGGGFGLASSDAEEERNRDEEEGNGFHWRRIGVEGGAGHEEAATCQIDLAEPGGLRGLPMDERNRQPPEAHLLSPSPLSIVISPCCPPLPAAPPATQTSALGTFASHARNSLAVAPPPLPMTAFGHIPAAGRRTKLPTNPARFSRISHIRAFYYDLASLPTFLQLPNGAANRDSVPAVAIAALMLSFSLDGGQTFSILLIPNRTLESNQPLDNWLGHGAPRLAPPLAAVPRMVHGDTLVAVCHFAGRILSSQQRQGHGWPLEREGERRYASTPSQHATQAI
nr:unnamed protein product [Digitaria exilis]